jgi:glycosyltransferase involved in cell wall biosynthesis
MNIDYPLISIIVITYKRIELLKKTISSFLENTEYPNLELILCDDGSPKNIQDEMSKLPFDNFLFSKKNQGLGINTNKGIIASRGNYIFQLQDDWVCNGPKDYLQLAIQAFNSIPNLGMIRFEGWENNNFSNIINAKFNNEKVIQTVKESANYYAGKSRIYSDRPHIKRKELHNELGLYLELKKMEITEIDFCNRMAVQNKFLVGFIKNYEDIFSNIGLENSLRKNQLKHRLKDLIDKNKFSRFLYKVYKKVK